MVVHERSGSLSGALTSALLFSAGAVAAYEYLSEPLPARSEAPREAPGVAEDRLTVGLARDPAPGGRLRAIVARRDAAWSRACEGRGALSEPRVAASPAGDVVMALTFEGAVDCGTGPIYAANEGDFDALVIAFDPLGRVRWTVHVAAPGAQAIAAVAIDPWGSALIAGSFEGTIDLGAAPMTAGSSRDALLAKLDADGDLVWQRHFGGGEPAFGVDVDVTRTGRALLLTRSRSPIDFGDGARQDPRATAFLAAFESDGRPAWSRGFVADGEIAPSRARALPGNQILMSGTFSGALDLGAGLVSSAGRSDAFLMRLDGEGRPLATARFGQIFASALPPTEGAEPPLTERLRDLVRRTRTGCCCAC